MEYTRSLRFVGCKYLLFFVVLLVVVLCVGKYSIDYPKYDFFWGFSKFVTWLVALLFLLRGIVFLIVGGAWKVLLTEDFIEWEVPHKSNFLFLKSDDSFLLNFNEIDYVLSEQGNVDFPDLSLIFITRLGERFRVSGESGINLSKVEKALVKRGVEIKYVNL